MSKRRAIKPSTDDFIVIPTVPIVWDEYAPELCDGDRWSTWGDGGIEQGPQPWPEWIITEHAAHDEECGILKTGKEADVHLIRRYLDDRECYLAAKRYRSADHKLFHRDGSYLAGRRVRKSREMRAMRTHTEFGKKLLVGQWAAYEWATLVDLYQAGLSVPYPVSYDGEEILMEFIATDDGTGAPRLADTRPSADVLATQFQQFLDTITFLVQRGTTHGDLSPYNVLVRDDQLVFIDWPQLVDVIGNPEGMGFLHRDVINMCAWFISRGLDIDAEETFAEIVAEI